MTAVEGSSAPLASPSTGRRKKSVLVAETQGSHFKDKRGERNIKALRVRCEHKDNGCNWTGKVAEAESHISQQCIYRMTVCPNMCKRRDGKETSKSILTMIVSVDSSLVPTARRKVNTSISQALIKRLAQKR